MEQPLDAFDEILVDIKPDGAYQKKWFFMFILPHLFLYPFVMNYLFLGATPDHWCHVPGQEASSLNDSQWKISTIPMEMLDDGTERFSKCNAYNISHLTSIHNFSRDDVDIISCSNGFQYDQSIYAETAVSYFNWVCDKKDLGANFYVLTFIAGVLGLCVSGPLMDVIGRKPIFFANLVLLTVFGFASVFATNEYVFLVLWLFRAAAHPSAYSAFLILCVEFLLPHQREKFCAIAFIIWVLGMSLIPLIFWLFHGNWFYSAIATSLPFLYFFIFITKFPESPRWLASKNKVEEARAIILRIAAENGSEVPEDLGSKLRPVEVKENESSDVKKFMTLPKQLLRVGILTSAWITIIITYHIIHLNLNNISWNIYIEFAIISLIEIPGYYLGMVLTMKFGRRFSVVCCFAWNAVFCLLTAVLPMNSTWPLIVISIIVKLGLAALFNIIFVHSPEIFPTAVRAFAMTFPNVISRLCNGLAPFVASLSDSHKALPFIVMGVLSLFCIPQYLFLPETKNRSLPQTMAEAENLGKDQKFFSLNLEPKKLEVDSSTNNFAQADQL